MALVVVPIVLAYSSSFGGTFVLDDERWILEREETRRTWPLGVAMADTNRPFGIYTLCINYSLHGENPWGYHAFNLLVHVGAALCLFGVIWETLSLPTIAERIRSRSHWIAAAVAVVWGVHPITTQSVTYIVQRLESMMGFCFLLCLYCFIRGAKSERPFRWWLATIIACAIGMGTKEVMVAAPLLLLWYDRAFLSKSWREIVSKRSWLYLGLAGTWAILVWCLLRYQDRYEEEILQVPITPWQYLITQSGILVHYLRLCFWPVGQVLDYGWRPVNSLADVWWQGPFIVALLVLTVGAIFRAPRWSFLGGWFFLILAPTSSVFPIIDMAYEHRMYLPSISVVVAVVLGSFLALSEARDRWASPSQPHLVWGAATVAMVVVLAIMTFNRNKVYHSEVAIWEDVARKRPDNPRAYHNLGHLANQQQQFEKAVGHFEKAVELRPDYAPPWHNLGLAQYNLGQLALAEKSQRTAIDLIPEYQAARYWLAKILLQKGRRTEGVAELEKAVEQNPEFVKGHMELAVAYTSFDPPRWDAALKSYESALENDPELVTAWVQMAKIHHTQGDLAEAQHCLEEAVRLAPENSSLRAILADIRRARQEQSPP